VPIDVTCLEDRRGDAVTEVELIVPTIELSDTGLQFCLLHER
jgi:hypothetical protein